MLIDKLAVIISLTAGVLFSLPATAQSLCDLIPAATVKSTLSLKEALVASPNTEWGNGCDYNVPQGKEPVVSADSSEDTGMDSIALTNHVADPNSDDKLIWGFSKAAVYTDDDHETDPSTPGIYYTRQSLIFRTKDKIVDFVVMTSGTSPTEAEILSLGKLAASKPIDKLKDPPN